MIADGHHELTDAMESAIIGALMPTPSLLDSISFLSADDFRDERMGMIYATIRTVTSVGNGAMYWRLASRSPVLVCSMKSWVAYRFCWV